MKNGLRKYRGEGELRQGETCRETESLRQQPEWLVKVDVAFALLPKARTCATSQAVSLAFRLPGPSLAALALARGAAHSRL